MLICENLLFFGMKSVYIFYDDSMMADYNESCLINNTLMSFCHLSGNFASRIIKFYSMMHSSLFSAGW